jgi:hypothetical protein
MNTILNITKGLTAEITIIENMVFVNTNYNGNARCMAYDSIQVAINETTMPAISNYLKSL